MASAHAYKSLDVAYATADNEQAISHATAEKSYWEGGTYEAEQPYGTPALKRPARLAMPNPCVAKRYSLVT